MKKSFIIIFAIVFYSILAYNLDYLYKNNIKKDAEIKKLNEKLYLDSLLISSHE
ncbi:MAG: hypothetical protein WCL51_14710 [Bacteroidota bacterium]